MNFKQISTIVLKIFLIKLALTYTQPVLGSAQVNVMVEPRSGYFEEPFQLTIAISGNADERPLIPEIPGLSIENAGQSSNFSWINGQSSREIIYTYQISAEKPGSYTIPSIEVLVDGKTINTEPFTFVALPSSATEQNTTNSDQNETPPIFIKREFSTTTPYEGQIVRAKTKVYYRVEINDPSRIGEKSPDLRYFDLDQHQSREQIGEHVYHVIVLDEAIVPLKSGKITIPPFKLSLHVLKPKTGQKRRRSVYDDFFSEFFRDPTHEMVKKIISSNESVLEVRPLPSEGMPKNFKGVVGDFTMEADLSNRELKTGETTTLTVTIQGKGLLDRLGKFDFEAPEGIKVYADKPEIVETENKEFGVISKRVYKFALVPTKAKNFDLGKLVIPVFQTEKESYTLLSKELGSLLVHPSPNEEKVVVASPEAQTDATVRSDVKALANDLLDVHRDSQLLSTHELEAFGLTFYLLIFGPFGLFLAGFFYRRVNERSIDNVSKRRSQALKKFKSAVSQNKDQLTETTVHLYFQAYKDFLGDKFNAHGQALTPKDIDQYLGKVKLSDQLKEQADKLNKTIDRLTYGTASLPSTEIPKLIGSVTALVEEIDKKC